MGDFSLLVNAKGYALVRRRLRLNLRRYNFEQRKNMRLATNLLRKETRARGRASGLKTKRQLSRAVRTRLRRLSPGEFEGRVFFGPRQFHYRILQGASVVRATARGGVLGIRRGHPFMEEAAKAKENEALEILGDSFRVFT